MIVSVATNTTDEMSQARFLADMKRLADLAGSETLVFEEAFTVRRFHKVHC